MSSAQQEPCFAADSAAPGRPDAGAAGKTTASRPCPPPVPRRDVTPTEDSLSRSSRAVAGGYSPDPRQALTCSVWSSPLASRLVAAALRLPGLTVLARLVARCLARAHGRARRGTRPPRGHGRPAAPPAGPLLLTIYRPAPEMQVKSWPLVLTGPGGVYLRPWPRDVDEVLS